MKKILYLTVLFALLGSVGLFAGDLVAGVRLGAGHGGILGSDKPDNQMFAPGFSAGIFGRYSLKKHVSVQGEVFYSSIQNKLGSSSTDWASALFKAISLPVYLRLDSSGSSAFGFYGMIGPRMDFYFDNFTRKTQLGNLSASSTEKMTQSQLRQFHLGMAAGAGVKLPAGPGLLDIGAAFHTSFLSMDSNAVSKDNRVKASPWGIEVQIGYGFKL